MRVFVLPVSVLFLLQTSRGLTGQLTIAVFFTIQPRAGRLKLIYREFQSPTSITCVLVLLCSNHSPS